MPSIAEIRQKAGGAYDDMDDQVLADKIYGKFYSDMPRADFDAKLGLGAPADQPKEESAGFAKTATDVGKQALSGLVTGTEAIPGTVPSILGLAGRGLNALGIGNQEKAQEQANLKALIDQNRNGGMAQYLPKPETGLGEAARNIAEFVPGGLGIRGGLRPALAGGVGSELAGQATEGTPAEPYARLAGGLVGGLAGARSGTNAEARAAVRALPARQEIDDAAKGLYGVNDAATMGVPVAKSDVSVFGERLRTKLNREGVRGFNGPAAHAAVDDIVKNTNDVFDLVKAREVIKRDLLSSPQGGDRRGAKIIVDALDEAIDATSPKGVGVLKAADREYSIARTLEAMDKRFAKIEQQTAAANSGKNLGNKYRQSLTSLRNNESAIRGLKPDEIAQIERTIKGSPTENLLRNMSNRLGGGGGLGQTALASGLGLGGAGAFYGAGADPQTAAQLGLGIGFLGSSLRGAANRMTAKQAKKLSEMVAARSALSDALPGPGRLRDQGLLAMLATAPASRGLLSAFEPAQ